MALALAATGCGPMPTGPWKSRDPGTQGPKADLVLQRCEAQAPCQLRLRSFADHELALDLSDVSGPCALWMSEQGQWLDRPPAAPLLELWLGELPGRDCPALRSPSRGAPRWMLLPHPIESAQAGGMGTTRPRYTLSRQTRRVREGLIAGHFDGVLSLGRGETEFLADLELATIRSGRQWLAKEVFSLIFGQNPALGRPELSQPARSHRPDLWSRDPNLELWVTGLRDTGAQLELRAVRARHSASFQIPRLARKKPRLRERANVEPCLDCGPRRRNLR